MAGIDDELLLDEQENQREIAYIRKRMPSEVSQRITDGQMQWMLDMIVEYYVDSGVFDTDGDEVDIDIELVAQHVCKRAAEEGEAVPDPQDVCLVVEGDLDFQEEDF